ncbi:pre-mRNA-splicing factor ISY1 homolog [Zophobas morio]|jgi:pre-mRNA-splicing factor ISY1|uniref:pre-mRNA-splicing factor ISY1 homolog n=1 Tax=Zophobas morio TaxID=2755281 RepID=UPI003083531B
MARNQEKAMSMLSRWRAAREAEFRGSLPTKRPCSANDINDLNECERWRNELVKEITKKISHIQNASLGEFKIRDLNDEINKLIREKRHWEYRIRELGGPDYFKIGSKVLDREGKEVAGQKGYRYFGAARDLPGVRELFEPEQPKVYRRTRAQMMKLVNADYYGYRDEEDGVILELEKKAEEEAIQRAVKEWEEEISHGFIGEDSEASGLHSDTEPLVRSEMIPVDEENRLSEHNEFVGFVSVPSQDEIEKYLVEHQKKMLLKRYVNEEPYDFEMDASSISNNNNT